MMLDARRTASLVSIVTPAYNEAANLPVMHERLQSALTQSGLDWEWIIIDDCSSDNTFAVAAEMANRDLRVRALRFSRNFGSHTATICGLEHARGDCAIAMASDLQDPPETIPELLAEWTAGHHVVWAVRASRHGESRSMLAFSQFYYWLMRKVAGLKNMPATGADFVLLDRAVIDAISQFHEHDTSFFALVTWMGFNQTSILYEKQARLHGRSGWTLRKKIKLLVDSLTSFTYQPIRWISLGGLVASVVGVLYAMIVVVNALFGVPVQGWASLMVVVLFLGGGQMFMLGVLGEYIWRGLNESRRRPRYLIERIAGAAPSEKPGPAVRKPISTSSQRITELDATGGNPRSDRVRENARPPLSDSR
jgi:glycosyltransferase involved in cell wall biosynthesis